MMPPKSRAVAAIDKRARGKVALPPEPAVEEAPVLPDIHEELYLGPYDNRKELEADCDFWDATTAYHVAWCPRNAQYHSLGLAEVDEPLFLIAGNAIHAALHVLYTTDNEELALHVLRVTFGEHRRPPHPKSKYGHINLGFLEVIMKNYFVWRRKHDAFEPLIVRREQLCLDDVVAAVIQVLPDERVVIGESKIVMRFDVDGEEFVYAGKPDLPILTGGEIEVFDHKSTNGRLGEWWAEKHRLSNQLRGYCRMIEKLLPSVLNGLGRSHVEGALINAIYMGSDATATKTKSGKPSTVTKFSRFGPYLFHADHLDEAIVNQWWWRNMLELYAEFARTSPAVKKFGWGQHTGKMCQGCPYQELCKDQPAMRKSTMLRSYTRRERKFLDL